MRLYSILPQFVRKRSVALLLPAIDERRDNDKILRNRQDETRSSFHQTGLQKCSQDLLVSRFRQNTKTTGDQERNRGSKPCTGDDINSWRTQATSQGQARTKQIGRGCDLVIFIVFAGIL